MATTATTTSSTTPKGKGKQKPRQKQRKQTKPKMTKEERRLKYTNIARERRQKQNHKKKHSNTICFFCRKRGHAVSECPYNNNDNGNGDKNNQQNNKVSSSTRNICFKCGETSHSLKACPKLSKEEVARQQENGRWNYHNMDLPFATCFICKQTGHLSSQCTLNTKGIYINGSGCKFCGKNDHLFMYCPEKKKKCRIINDDSDGDSAGNVDAFLEEESGKKDVTDSVHSSTNVTTPAKKKKKKKVVTF